MTETQWRPRKDAPTDGTPIIVWLIHSSGMVSGARFGEVERDGETFEGWFTFDPLAENGYGGMEFAEDDEKDFLWMPFPQWELAESLGKALIRRQEAENKPPSEDAEE